MKTILGRWHTTLSLGALLATILVAVPTYAQQNSTAKLLELATNGTGQARYVAIDDLGERAADPAAVVPVLTKLLTADDPQVQWRSARALGDFGADAVGATPQLRSFLSHQNPAFQVHAALALGKVGDCSDETIKALAASVVSPDGRVSRAAISALRNLNPDPECVAIALDHVLGCNDQAVVAEAFEAVVERGGKAVPMLNAALKRPNTAFLACAAIEQIGPEAAATVPALTELISTTKHSHLLIEALLALGSIGPAAQSAVPQIVPLLDHSTDATVPVAAAYALGSIGNVQADAALRAAMTKKNPMLQMVAVWSLAKIHPQDAALKKQAVDRLQAGLTSDDPAIQKAAEKGLQLLESPKAAP